MRGRNKRIRLEEELRVFVGEHVSDAASRQCRAISKRNRKYSAWQGASQMQALAALWDEV